MSYKEHLKSIIQLRRRHIEQHVLPSARPFLDWATRRLGGPICSAMLGNTWCAAGAAGAATGGSK
jgi:hypothetical protein